MKLHKPAPHNRAMRMHTALVHECYLPLAAVYARLSEVRQHVMEMQTDPTRLPAHLLNEMQDELADALAAAASLDEIRRITSQAAVGAFRAAVDDVMRKAMQGAAHPRPAAPGEFLEALPRLVLELQLALTCPLEVPPSPSQPAQP